MSANSGGSQRFSFSRKPRTAPSLSHTAPVPRIESPRQSTAQASSRPLARTVPAESLIHMSCPKRTDFQWAAIADKKAPDVLSGASNSLC